MTTRNLNYIGGLHYILLDSAVLDKVLSIKAKNVKMKGKVSVFLEFVFYCWWGEGRIPETISELDNTRKNVRLVF